MNRISAGARVPSHGFRRAACFAGLAEFEAYRQLYAPGADVEATSSDFFAAVEGRLAGSLVVTRRTLQNVVHSRDAERVARDAFDHLTLGFLHAGELELQTDRSRRTVRAGEIVLQDMTRASRHLARAEMTTVSLPRALVPEALASSGRLHGLQISGLAGAPLKQWLERDSHGPQAEQALAAALADTLEREMGERALRPVADRQDRVRELIETRIADQMLSPEHLARRLGMSRATLYRAFGALGSVERWRQGRRLLHLKAALAFTDLPVSEAAHNVGLENPSHASALFSKAFGLSPSQFRRSAAELDEGADLVWIFENVALLTLRAQTSGSAPRW